jgi:hypothetical protein
MKKNQKKSVIIFAALTATCSLTWAQTPNGTTLEQQLEAEYTITTPTADNTDLVTTGAVLILQKKGLSAGSVSSKVATLNTYKDGQIKAGAAAAVRRFGALPGIGYVPGVGGMAGTAAGAAGGSRDFVNGEKVYVTKITVDRAKDSIIFDLISDAYGDAGRYKASLRFEFPKKSLVSADFAKIQPTIAEVFKVAPPADPNASASAAQGGQPAATPAPAAAPAPVAAPAAPPEPALAPIAPPPPPPADPKSIENGMTKDQVVAIMGEPVSKVKAGTKDIYTYKDLKVIFINGKMTDAQ